MRLSTSLENSFRRALPLALAACLSASISSAQSLFGIASNGDMLQFNGPKDPACNYPSGPLLGQYGYALNFFCPHPGVLPAAPSLLGDVALDRGNDELYITDGTSIARTQSFGTIVAGFDAVIPGSGLGALTGLGWDATSGWLWVTDGPQAAAYLTPADPGCPVGASIVVGPFALPLGAGALATDIDWDPQTNSLWVCDNQGIVTNVLPNGALGSFGAFNASATSPCGLGTVLHGLAVDTGAPAGTVYVTDGVKVAYMSALGGGGPATPTFYSPGPCNPALAPYKGLAWSASGTLYGTASNGFFPILGASEPSIVPNPDYSIIVAGAKKNTFCGLVWSVAPLCPFVPLGNGKLYVLLLSNSVLSVKLVPDTGLVTFPLPIPPSVPIGQSLYFQGLTFDPTNSNISSSPGLEIRTSFP
jgi:hypothetical protein